MTRRSLVALIACLLASLVQSVFFVYAQVPENEEEMYMFLGREALTGRISLFQDELIGNRLPLPYYVIGLSQLLWPGSLIAARLTSVALGLACLVLVFLIARRLGGELAGILALLFGVTHSLVIGKFASAKYYSLVSLLLLIGFYVLFCTNLRYRRVAAMALVSLLFFTRTNLLTLIPFMLLYLLWSAEGRGERLALLAVTVASPVAFFASDPNHLKLLAYVPVFNRLVLPLGFRSNAAEFAYFYAPEDPVASTLVLLGRWHRIWILAVLGLLAAIAIKTLRGRPVPPLLASPGVRLVTATTLWIFFSQLLAVGAWNARYTVAYTPAYALLAAICLGCWFAVMLEDEGTTRRARTVGLVLLCALFAVGPSQSRPPMLPLAVSYREPLTVSYYHLADALAKTIPKGSKVFRFGDPLGLYVAGRTPYLRQERDVLSFSPLTDERTLRRSGLWGDADIRYWLGTDADYAVVSPQTLQFFRGTHLRPSGELVESLLQKHFVQVAVLDQFPGELYYVYKRRGMPS